MSNSEPKNEATRGNELKEFIKSLSEKATFDTIAVTKESLRKEGAIMLKVFGEINEETSISNKLEVELAGEVRQPRSDLVWEHIVLSGIQEMVRELR